MKNDLFINLPQRIEGNYPELENEMLLELRKKDKDYEQIHEQFYTMEEQYPFIMEVLEGKGPVALTERNTPSCGNTWPCTGRWIQKSASKSTSGDIRMRWHI